VSGQRFYWAAYWHARAAYFPFDPDAVIAEGFAADLETAVANAMQAADAKPEDRHWDALHVGRFPRKRRDGNHVTRHLFRVRHARRPPPSSSTDSRPEGMLGSLWSEYPYGTRTESTFDGWYEHPITKITTKRIFIRSGWRNVQHSFDREELEREGKIWTRSNRYSHCYYTTAGRDAWIAEGAERWSDYVRANYPLLDLPEGFNRRDVLRAYRKKSHELHPDHGGDAEAFRNLTAEKNAALRAAEHNWRCAAG
jgi:hypothetical protein